MATHPHDAKVADSAATALNVPLRVYYPTPQIVANAHNPTMCRRSSLSPPMAPSTTRIVDHDTRDRYARDVLKAVRDSRFRPRFVDGHAVAATLITYRQVFWTSKPRD